MRLTVFGATGGIGEEIVRQALIAGHDVTAVVRDPARLAAPLSREARVHTARLTDPEDLRPAVAGRHAVLSGLGARRRRDAGAAAACTHTVLRALEAEGVRRFLAVSAGPLGPVPEGASPLLRRVVAPALTTVLKDVYADLAVMEDEIRASATDWTVVRPPRLLNIPLTGTYRTAFGTNPPGGATMSIGRADVAHLMLALIDDPAAVKQAVGVAY